MKNFKGLNWKKQDSLSIADGIFFLLVVYSLIWLVAKMNWPIKTDGSLITGIILLTALVFVAPLFIKRTGKSWAKNLVKIGSIVVSVGILSYAIWINFPMSLQAQVKLIWQSIVSWLPFAGLLLLIIIYPVLRRKFK